MYLLITLTLVFGVLCLDPVWQDLATPMRELGEGCGYESCPTVKDNMLNVHIVPHTHGELGHTKTFYQHYTGYDDYFAKSNINMKRALDFIISELWAHEERKFTLSDSPYLFHWWANRDETVRRMVYQLIRQGRLHFVGGGWGMPDESCTSYVGLIDQFTYALRKINSTFLSCGRPLVAWQADVFGHSREFTSLAALMAFDGLFINPISFEDELLRMRNKDLEMLWRGSDDLGSETDIFTHKLFDGYWSPPGFCFGSMCKDPHLITNDPHFKNIDERVDVFLDLVKNRQSPSYATNHIMVMMGKRMGYYDAPMWFDNIDVLIQRVNGKGAEKGVNVFLSYSAPHCYLRAVHATNPALPIKQDDFLPVAYDKLTYFSGLYTSRPTIKFMVREGQVFLQMAKQLQVLARLTSNDKMFEELNWIMGVMQDHNVITGAMRPHVKDYYTHKMYCAVQKSTLVLKQAFNKLRKSPTDTMYYRCAFNVSSCTNTDSVRSFVVIYNPLSWHVTMPVRLPVSRAKYTVYNPGMKPVTSVLMKIPDSILRIPFRETIADHELVFMADRLPAMGFRSYFIELKYLNKKKRRSIIKKLKNQKKKKYIARQANQIKIDEQTIDSVLNDDDDYSDLTTVPTEFMYRKTFDEEIPYITSPNMRAEDEDVEIDSEVPEPKDDESKEEEPKEKVPKEEEPKKEEPKKVEPKKVEPKKEKLKVVMATRTPAPSWRKLYKDIDKKARDESKYYYRVSKDHFIENKYLTLTLDKENRVVQANLSNGVQIALKIQLLYYASDDPAKFGRDERQPGPNIFKPMDPKPIVINDYVQNKVHKTHLVQEVHCSFAKWGSFNLRVYDEKPVIEVDWVVGPIPTDDDIGKDVFIRYSTNLKNKGFFYTDSNGRQTVKRLRFDRPTYEPVFASIPGNFYPVTSKIYIEDTEKNIRFSVFNDRAQGGSSLKDGQVDVMLHRRILTDDNGVQTFLNDSEAGNGIVVRGKHYLYISKSDYKPNKIFEKRFAKEIELGPQIFASPTGAYGENSKHIWSGQVNEYSGITNKLPIGIHVLTLQEWNDFTLLVRLENYLEKADTVRSGVKTVFLKNLFKDITIDSARETTLAANVWLKDYVPLQWNAKHKFARNFNEFYRGNGSVVYSDDYNIKEYKDINIHKGINLAPQQIRTFVVTFHYDRPFD